ncbi:hypothetical protein GCM10010149_47940 [Nonomuraea roseoviolacea subsp. roseoviolacea]|uniref:hypothetical protein n=1 Tax=Nonomuraea roseoviolacea TaxID=103837 RepID=UPI0031D6C654
MTTLPTITDAQLIDAIKTVAAENPDRVYTSPEHMSTTGTCFYVHRDEATDELSPGCLVGAALHRLGVPLETLQRNEDTNAFNLLSKLFPMLTTQTCSFANSAQMDQDGGRSWGEAVAYAESRQLR